MSLAPRAGESRKRLPAYGAKLRDLTRTGALPLCVHLVYGFHWNVATHCCWSAVPQLPEPHPVLAIKPSDYIAGTLDFSVVTGLKVCVFDQDGRGGDMFSWRPRDDAPELKAFNLLLGELAQFASEVEVYTPANEHAYEAHRRAQLYYEHFGEWPYWWSDQIEQRHAERRVRWYDAFYRLTARAA